MKSSGAWLTRVLYCLASSRIFFFQLLGPVSYTHLSTPSIQTDRQTDRQLDRQTDRVCFIDIQHVLVNLFTNCHLLKWHHSDNFWFGWFKPIIYFLLSPLTLVLIFNPCLHIHMCLKYFRLFFCLWGGLSLIYQCLIVCYHSYSLLNWIIFNLNINVLKKFPIKSMKSTRWLISWLLLTVYKF